MPAHRKYAVVHAKCAHCDAAFQTTEGRLAAGRGRFCSRQCSGVASATQHGHSTNRGLSPTYTSWTKMRGRCGNKRSHKYPSYGGRGIKVCERWQSFDAFLADMGERPAGHTLDRIDNDGDYSPENCRWATPKAQQVNQARTKFVTFRGQSHPLATVADRLGVSWATLNYRVGAGWPEDDWGKPARKWGRG